jgi:hypothetical protein
VTGAPSSSHEDEGDEAVAAFDLELIYRNLGELVVVFQALESTVFQLGVLALGLEEFDRSRRQLADRSFKDPCGRVERAVTARLDALGRPAPDLRAQLRAAIERCDELRVARNRVVHSAYVSLEAGGQLQGLMRSDLRRAARPAGLDVDLEHLGPDSFRRTARAMAEAALAVEHVRVQLAMWTPADTRVSPTG